MLVGADAAIHFSLYKFFCCCSSLYEGMIIEIAMEENTRFQIFYLFPGSIAPTDEIVVWSHEVGAKVLVEACLKCSSHSGGCAET